ncbi:MAG: S9 family peptidase [Pyrinomonadaceae bacterium]
MASSAVSLFPKTKPKIAFTFSSAKNNSDIWIYDRKTFGLTQVTKSDRSDISQESFIEPELIKYKSFDGKEIPAWYYKPKNTTSRRRGEFNFSTTYKDYDEAAKTSKVETSFTGRKEKTGDTETSIETSSPQTKKNPAGGPTSIFTVEKESLLKVIVSVHGGPEGQSRPGFNPLFQYHLSRGYAVLDPNVRGSTGYGKAYSHLDDVEKREDSVKDLAAAHQWLVKNGGADPKRIAVMGGSYGGYMTMAAITLYPDLWAAAVNTVGIVNWETFLQNTSGYRRRQREVEYGMLDKNIDFLRAISPIKKIDKIKTPLFVIHGKNDPRVPYTEAEQVVKALKDRNAVVEYKLYDDEGHGISKLKNRLDLYPLVADFLDKYMK